jgi:uncharacterized protein (TIGR02246 family)
MGNVSISAAKSFNKGDERMLRNGCIIACLVFVVMVTGCANPPTPAPDTRQVDIQTIRDLEAESLKDLANKDADKFFSIFADDASGLYPGMAILEGKQAITTSLTPMIADPNYSFTMKSLRMEASKGGDMVYSLSTYVMTTTDAKTKKPKTEKGKYLTIYRKQTGGSWKAVVDAAVPDSGM